MSGTHGGVRGNTNLGDNGLIGDIIVLGIAVDANVDLSKGWNAGDMGDTAKAAEVKDTMRSNIDSGDAGRSGDAIGNSACMSKAFNFCGGMRNGLIGDSGAHTGVGD